MGYGDQQAAAQIEVTLSNTRPERRSLRAEQKLLTRRRLLDAATEVFAERGFVAATVDDIVNAAEVSRATFYLHYANKEAILEDLNTAYLPQLTARFVGFGDVLAERTELRTWMIEMVRFLRGHRGHLAAIAEAGLAGESFVFTQRTEAVDAIMAQSPTYLATTGDGTEARVRLELVVAQLLSLMAFEWPHSDEQLASVLADQWRATLATDSIQR